MALRSNTKQTKADEAKVKKMFEKYANDPEDNLPGRIGPNGMVRLLGELKLADDDRQVLILAQKMEAQVMCEFSWEEWQKGMQAMGACSEATLRNRLAALDKGLKSLEDFKPVYNFAFNFSKRPGTRNLDMDCALIFWKILFKDEYPLLPIWEEFMTKAEKKSVTKDAWNMMLDFATTVKTDFSDFDETESWPSMFDDFVDWCRKNSKV